MSEPASSYEEQLKIRTAQLQDVMEKLSDANRDAITLGADIKLLEARIAELQNVLSGYDQLTKDYSAARNLLDQKLSMTEAVLKDRKAAIDKEIAAFDSNLAMQNDALKKGGEAVKSASDESVRAEDDAKSKRDALAAAIGSPKTLRDQLKDLKNALSDAGTAESKGDHLAAYIVLTDAATRLPAITTSAPDLKSSIIQAQKDVEAAKAIADAKKKAADDAVADYGAKKHAYDEAVRSRQDTLIQQLKAP